MDVNTILQAVGTVGFPIVCAIAMEWFVKKLYLLHYHTKVSPSANINVYS